MLFLTYVLLGANGYVFWDFWCIFNVYFLYFYVMYYFLCTTFIINKEINKYVFHKSLSTYRKVVNDVSVCGFTWFYVHDYVF